MDLSITKATPLLVLFNILLLLLMAYLLKPAWSEPYHTTRGKYRTAVALTVAFCLFSFWGADWFGYQQTYYSILAGYQTNLESLYVWLIEDVCSGYMEFRLIVWGLALIFYYVTINRLSVPKHLSLFVFCTCFLIWFSYARVSLAMAMMYCGLTFIYKPIRRQNILSFLIGLILVAVSFYFHKSAMFGILIILFVMLTMFTGRSMMWLALFMTPLIVLFAKDTLAEFMMMDFSIEDEALAENMAAGQGYLEKVQTVHGIGAILQSMLERLPHFLTAYLCLRWQTTRAYLRAPKEIQAFSRVMFFIVLGSSVFLLNLGVNTATVFIRFLRFAAIPCSFVLAYFYKTGYKPKLTRFTIQTLWTSVAYSMLYSMYNSSFH